MSKEITTREWDCHINCIINKIWYLETYSKNSERKQRELDFAIALKYITTPPQTTGNK